MNRSAKAFCSKPSSSILDEVMIQEVPKQLYALHLRRQRRLNGIIEFQRDDIAEPLVWMSAVVMFLDRTQGAARAGITEQNQVYAFRDFLTSLFITRHMFKIFDFIGLDAI
jgi:hypothetical protein